MFYEEMAKAINFFVDLERLIGGGIFKLDFAIRENHRCEQ